ncbi:MAG TPA: hypothetical protein VFR50_12175 [Casimicrobiaceae bacterium]|jgi:hypothetical protein|nr:hypothetical protein [Casimicrobiaceae bacterium]
MKKYPITVSKRAVRKGADHALQPSDPEARGPWISFHYSCTEISATGTTARVRSKRASCENGRLRSESFEGELDRDHAERVLFEAQRRFSEQAALFVRSLFGFPALPRRSRSEWD